MSALRGVTDTWHLGDIDSSDKHGRSYRAFGQTAKVIMAGKIPASDFAAVVDAVEQRRAMEEYGNEDWVIHAIN